MANDALSLRKTVALTSRRGVGLGRRPERSIGLDAEKPPDDAARVTEFATFVPDGRKAVRVGSALHDRLKVAALGMFKDVKRMKFRSGGAGQGPGPGRGLGRRSGIGAGTRAPAQRGGQDLDRGRVGRDGFQRRFRTEEEVELISTFTERTSH